MRYSIFFNECEVVDVGCAICHVENVAMKVCGICHNDVCLERCATWRYYRDDDNTLKWEGVCVRCKLNSGG